MVVDAAGVLRDAARAAAHGAGPDDAQVERADPARAGHARRCTSPSTGSRSAPRSRSGTTASPPSTWAPLCAQWFSDFLGRPLRLARFDPEAPRRADRKWTGAIEAANAFQDGFPLLVASTASLAEVNRRLARRRRSAGDAGALSSQPRPRRPRRARRGPPRRDRLRRGRRAGAAQAGQAVRPLLDPRRRSRPPASPATPSATCWRSTAPTRAWAARSPSRMNAIVVEGIDRTLRAGHARPRELRLRLRRRAPMHRFKTWQLFAICVVVWGTTWHAITYQLVRLLRRVRRRASLRPRRRWPCSRSAAGAACRSAYSLADHGALALQGVFLYGVSYVCVYHAERFVPSGLVAVGYSASPLLSGIGAALLFGAAARAGASSPAACSACAASSSSSGPRSRAPSGGERAALGALLTVASVLLSAVGSLAASRNRQRGIALLPAMGFGMLYGALAARDRRPRARPQRRLADGAELVALARLPRLRRLGARPSPAS